MRSVVTRIASFALVMLLAFSFFDMYAVAKNAYGKVNCSELSVRASASVKAKRLGTISEGTVVKVVGTKNGWCKIKYDGSYGYVAKDYLTHSTASGKTSTSTKVTTLKRGSSGSSVKKLQKRLHNLNYLSSSEVTGTYGPATEKAVKLFQLFNGLSVTGTATKAVQKKIYAVAYKRKKIQNWDWYDCPIDSILNRNGGTAYIIDVNTGTRINIRRVGGLKHADVEPKTASDTAKLKKIYGGKWSWDRRAVILVVNGNYIAASINGYPHGKQISTTNHFDGQFCLHLTNSHTHGSDKADPDHEACIKKALKWGNS